MKKLMIAAFAVAFAAVAQAASVSWSCTLVKDGTSDLATKPNNSGIAYLMLASDVADFTALAGQGLDKVNEALSAALTHYTPTTAGNYGHASMTNSELKLSDSTQYGNAYLVIFNTTEVTEESSFFISKTAELITLTGDNDSGLTFGSQATNSKAADNWHAVAVPEPTSGLMMLLGLGALALRRRRA